MLKKKKKIFFFVPPNASSATLSSAVSAYDIALRLSKKGDESFVVQNLDDPRVKCRLVCFCLFKKNN